MKQKTFGLSVTGLFKTQKTKPSSRGRTPEGDPNPVDVHVGNRIRLRRQLMGYNQEKLAALLGVSFQQVQKYEQGNNRVSASRLWDISKVLAVPVSFFFDDMDPTVAGQSPRKFQSSDPCSATEDKIEPEPCEPMQKEETLELVRAYYKIPNRQAARQMFELIISMSKAVYPQDKKK